MEGLLPKNYGDDAVEIPGARTLLQELIDRKKPWAIVTSGSLPLVSGVSNYAFVTPGLLLPLISATHSITVPSVFFTLTFLPTCTSHSTETSLICHPS